jgi:hypothetical protein
MPSMSFHGFLPVGSIIHSMLTEAQFQGQAGVGWVLADGRSVAGSTYATVSGNSTIPDLRGVFIRGKNNSRSDGNQDPAGERSIGAFQSDQNLSHSHTLNINEVSNGAGGQFGFQETSQVSSFAIGTSSSGGSEARPRNVALNIFIKIN